MQANQEFQEIASKLLDRINSVNFRQRKQKVNDISVNSHNYGETRKMPYTRSLSINAASPQTQTALELAKIEQDLNQNQQQNCRKLRNLNEEIRKIEIYIKEQNETRLKINENFIHNIVKAEKNMHNALANIRKVYAEREKKLEAKIEQVLRQEKKQILEQLQHDNSLEQEINRVKLTVKSLNQQLVQMRKSRKELQDKITRQFSNQITDLKAIFNNSIKQRDERQLKVLQMLKNVYRKHMQSLRKEEIDRDSSEKMFLTVIQQLINRITEA